MRVPERGTVRFTLVTSGAIRAVIPFLQERYKETDSPLVRNEIEQYMGVRPCPDCGGVLGGLGEDVSEMLEFVPGRFKVIRTVRPKLACGQCDAIVQAPAPHRRAGPSRWPPPSARCST